mgnify:CR=1 FL=1
MGFRITRYLSILLLLGMLFILPGKSFALPPCPEEPEEPWSNCIGTYLYENGDKYVGEFSDGMRNGNGTYTYANGNKYKGLWIEDKKNGKGEFIFPNGNKYIGDFVDGKWTGKGTLTNYFGDKYIGEFKNGQRHGKGTVSSVDGFTYEGIFANDAIVPGKGRIIKASVKSKGEKERLKNVCPGARNAKCPRPPKQKRGLDLSLKPNRLKKK